MILHFVKDEKVVDQIIENFSRVYDQNIFLVFCRDVDGHLFRHIKHTEKVQCFDPIDNNINNVIAKNKVRSILVHGLFVEFIETILKIEKELRIGWYVWGFDLYGLPKIRPEIYAPITDQFLMKNTKLLRLRRVLRKNRIARKFYYQILVNKVDPLEFRFKALVKMQFFISYLKEDYDYFGRYYKNNLTFIDTPFSTIDQYLAGNRGEKLDSNAKNILIGNSNSPESNHLDVLLMLKNTLSKSELANIDIYVPLSYGENDKYKDEIIGTGKSFFRDIFKPMLTFMDRDSYMNVLLSCSIGIFFHYRQQAMGNIIAMLWFGSRIYLSKKNPAYYFFKRKNMHVFDLESEFSIYKLAPLDDNQIKENRTQLNNMFSGDNIDNGLKVLIQVLLDE
ncbi:MAG: TDP-N-acetylfucosamine:lipid II N-acetylfucosaminyltransferase [Calditrichaceae bacterium]